MGMLGWSATPARNSVADSTIPARDGASGRDLPGLVRGVMAGVRRFADAQGGALVTGGGLNAYTVDTGLGVAELRPGIALTVRSDRDNTAEATLNVDGLGPLPWVDAGGVRLLEGRILKGRFYSVILDVADDGTAAWRVQAGASTLSEIPGLTDLQDDVATKAEAAIEAAAATVLNAQTATQKAVEATGALSGAQSARLGAEAARDTAFGAVGSGLVSTDTLAQLTANLAPASGALGEVDSDNDNTGTYRKSGGTGTGTWSKISNETRATARRAGAAIGGSLSALQGGRIITLSDVNLGNAAAIGSPAAVGDQILLDGGNPLSDGAILTLRAGIKTLGTGLGAFVLCSPVPDGTFRTEAIIPVTVRGTGVQTFVAGIDFPPVAAKAGWLLGWFTSVGGALISYIAGGVSRNYGIANPTVGNVHAFATGAFQISVGATQLATAQRVGNPVITGTAARALALWVEGRLPLPAGPLRTLEVYIQAVGNGLGEIDLVSPREGGAKWHVEARIPFTVSATGAVVLRAGVDFPATAVQEGWCLGFYSGVGGAQIAFNALGSGWYAYPPAIVEGADIACITTAAKFSIAATVGFDSPGARVRRRLEIAEARLIELDAARTFAVRDSVLTCSVTVAGATASVEGLLRRGRDLIPYAGTLAIPATATFSVIDEAMTIAPSQIRYAGIPVGNHMAHGNVANVVVKDAVTGAVLVRDTDYFLATEHGVIALNGTGTRAVLVSYTWTQRRYDAVFLNPKTLALSLVTGTARDRDASEFIPANPSARLIRLANLRGSQGARQVIETYDVDRFTGLRRTMVPQFRADQAWARRSCPKTIAKIRSGQPVKIATLGDSIVAIQSSTPSSATPNGTQRDRAAASGTTNTYLRDAISADVVDALPLYDTGDGAGQVHTRMSFAWTAMREWARTGSLFTYLNFGVAGTSSVDALDGARTAINAIIAAAPDLVFIHYGMNEYLDPDGTYDRLRIILDLLYAAGIEVVVLTLPRRNAQWTEAESFWTDAARAARDAAEYVNPDNGRSAAVLDAALLYASDALGALGMSADDICAANLFNHPGIREHVLRGVLLALLLIG